MARAAHEVVQAARMAACGSFGGGLKGREVSVVATDEVKARALTFVRARTAQTERCGRGGRESGSQYRYRCVCGVCGRPLPSWRGSQD